ncbi:carboxypeptidase regulatory-like domain-containing protein [Streptomyces sp. S.PB5]|uniref:carboxypeptidase regulatory-like domain-containing protein n=1 Tax=Streptomyces sp. S.PB5 TaxID=3020844 RepID=UPI0025B2363B|nr:carboxypeptidase regulatory-like domain-containing protein [Streptomyces sp. S.PB5]MDN3023563.1 carboxypeptidase regulatory-like domain-containing protein [Streptomyces sp. S.PB5]
MSWKTLALGIATLTLVLTAAESPKALATGGRELWGAVSIVPGRQGIVQVSGYTGPALGRGSRLTLTAPEGTEVTDTPLDASGYRGFVDTDGDSATYTYTGPAAGRPWQEQSFPFVIAVPADAVPGTRLTGCAMRLTDARGTRKDHGVCAVTVGLPEPTLTRPASGVALVARPETAGTAHPGSQVTVRHEDAQDEGVTGQGPEPGAEVCTATAGADGKWSCQPAAALPAGPGRLQATATLNGVSAVSEQIYVTVGTATR